MATKVRAFLYRGFLSDEECDHLISLAHGAEEKNLGTSLHSENVFMNRTQSTTEDDIVERIEERISAWTFLPKENSKPLHIMHYGLEEGKQKLDYFGNESTLGLSERLMATVILYLSNVTWGGEILFPDSAVKNKIWSDCTKVSSVQRPIKGNAILFFTLHPNASLDESSSHARCPVLEGEMWCAAKFFQIREVKKEKISIESVGDECTDEDEDCPHWAAKGECQTNPLFMVGSPDYYGTCRKSCQAC
ncbi:probable prolyl 4-hydroxylase 12 isoform X2 [Mangifera indica]|uniref:probable prolyl 4-hydroxylase 12 isoform X2 n=1 Tax=Mangifera indica TaxID=29780 RepID=UPI001CFA10ED|nr:probable prolyl 4-hydroxylase 12 isoform X2 [Mangifera indica]XP_044467620.1 probable prolyl 4-hydroxylase 12 isoform X2 [Mangifera indica]